MSKYALLFGESKLNALRDWPSVLVLFGPFAIDCNGDGFLKFSAQFTADEIEVY